LDTLSQQKKTSPGYQPHGTGQNQRSLNTKYEKQCL
jgi:hypothetical protein